MDKNTLKKLIIKHSQPVGSWANSDGEHIDTDDRSFDNEDLEALITDIMVRLENDDTNDSNCTIQKC